MSNVLNNPQHVAKIAYNGFPLRQRTLFSSSVGHLLPVYHHLLNPGDKVNIDVELKTRTKELDAAAMTTINEHIEFFFVPLEHLYRFFGDQFYGIQDFDTSLRDFNGDQLTDNSAASEFPFAIPIQSLIGSPDFDSVLKEYCDEYDDIYLWKADGTARLLSHLGFPVDAFLDAQADKDAGSLTPRAFPVNVTCSALFALAYQKIYMDYYRISDRQPNDPSCYNVDAGFSYGDTYLDPDQQAEYSNIFEIRYRPIRKDFFHAQQISPLFGSQSLAALNGSQIEYINQWLTGVSSVMTLDPSGSAEDVEPTSVALGNKITPSYLSQVSPANIRTMFAAEKLMEITRRAGKHYDAQTLAHFGVEVPQGISGEVYFLGEHQQQINIGDVIATAGTENTPLGEIGGKGYGYGKGSFKDFTAPCHGVLMGIYSADVDFNYQQKGLDKLNAYISPIDWFRPEYDDLGMQPLFRYQSSLPLTGDGSTAGDILGWNYRYWELKMKYPRVLGSLAHNLRYWQVDIDSPVNTSLYNYLVHPDFLDNIMLVNYSSRVFKFDAEDKPIIDPNWRSTLFDSDPLIHELFCNVVIASKMSTYGLPSL